MSFSPEKLIKNVVPDILENFPSKGRSRAENSAETPEDKEKKTKLLERLLPEEHKARLRELTEELSSGLHRARILVGDKDKRTLHPHDFVIEKDDSGELRFYFIDPEHNIGVSKKRLRPPIAEILSFKLPTDVEDEPEIAFLRYRTPRVFEKDFRALKLKEQLEAGQQLLETGRTPEFIEDLEEEITYQYTVNAEGSSVEAVRQNEQNLATFLSGEETALALEGKVETLQIRLEQFERYLESGDFKQIEESEVV